MIASYRYHGVFDPIPPGWRRCENADLGHHSAHSILIERIPQKSGTPPSIVAIEHGEGAALTGAFEGKPFTIPLSLTYAAQLAGRLALIVETQLHRRERR